MGDGASLSERVGGGRAVGNSGRVLKGIDRCFQNDTILRIMIVDSIHCALFHCIIVALGQTSV